MYHNKDNYCTDGLNVTHDLHKLLILQEMLAFLKNVLIELVHKNLESILKSKSCECESLYLFFFRFRDLRPTSNVNVSLGLLPIPESHLLFRNFIYKLA